MAKMLAHVFARYKKQRYRTGMLLDNGSSFTGLRHADARELGLHCRTPTDSIPIGGKDVPVCFRKVSLQIEKTDCLSVDHVVAVSTSKDRDFPISIIGTDFMQRAGMVLDHRQGRHAVLCDLRGRDPKTRSGEVVWAKGEHLNGKRR